MILSSIIADAAKRTPPPKFVERLFTMVELRNSSGPYEKIAPSRLLAEFSANVLLIMANAALRSAENIPPTYWAKLLTIVQLLTVKLPEFQTAPPVSA